MYRCPNCSAGMRYDIYKRSLKCDYCGYICAAENHPQQQEEAARDDYEVTLFSCPQCGGQIRSTDNAATDFCSYCGASVVLEGRLVNEKKPAYIIPFSRTKEECKEVFKKRAKKAWCLPNAYKDPKKLEKFTGIYIPYWIVNADYQEADWISGTVKRGKSSETRFYSRSGDIKFKNVPVDGSRILNDDVSMRLEPFYLEDSKEFDEDYLNGFYSNTSDMDYMDLRESASKRCHKLFADEVVKSIPKNARNVNIRDSIYWADVQDDPIYMMFPVWFLTFKYNGKPYTVLVNGQTGKVTGTLPWQNKKIWAIAITTFVLVIAFIAALFFVVSGGAAQIVTFFWAAGAAALLGTSTISFTVGFNGLRRILRNLRLSQSEAMFNFVKRRQS